MAPMYAICRNEPPAVKYIIPAVKAIIPKVLKSGCSNRRIANPPRKIKNGTKLIPFLEPLIRALNQDPRYKINVNLT